MKEPAEELEGKLKASAEVKSLEEVEAENHGLRRQATEATDRLLNLSIGVKETDRLLVEARVKASKVELLKQVVEGLEFSTAKLLEDNEALSAKLRAVNEAVGVAVIEASGKARQVTSLRQQLSQVASVKRELSQEHQTVPAILQDNFNVIGYLQRRLELSGQAYDQLLWNRRGLARR